MLVKIMTRLINICHVFFSTIWRWFDNTPINALVKPTLDIILMDHFVCKYPGALFALGGGMCVLVVTCHPRRDSASTITIICFPLFTVQTESVMMKSVSFAHCESRGYSFPGSHLLSLEFKYPAHSGTLDP